MIRSIAMLICVASAALGDPQAQTLAPVWPLRAFEQELGAKGVVVVDERHPSQLASRQIGLWIENEADASADVAEYLERLGPSGEAIDPKAVKGEGDNALVFRSRVGVMPPKPDLGVRTLVFVSLRDTRPYEVERTWMAYEPATTEGVDGLAVIVPGTFGYPAELYEKWSLELRQRGWSVLRLLSQPSRFTERVDYEIGAGEGALVGEQFAKHADDRTAECAYAVEAGTAWIEAHDDRLKAKPRAILGFSGGAILQSSVVAREPDRYEHVVIVAGGANAASISIDSTFMKQYIRSVFFEFRGEDPAKDRADFEAAYLKHATLDTYHAVASYEDDTSVLVLDGSFDKAVPFASSTLMFERLEASGVDPIHRTYPSNHIMLFMSLAELMDDVNAWIDGGELALPPGLEAKEPSQAP